MLHRQCFIRSENATIPQLDGYGMSGLFGKLVNALAKPFTKIFKPHTLLGKIADPLGLASRNLKWTYKVADVVGTAATLAVGAWAVGAAAGGAGAAGGFWSTAGAGAKVIGGGALKALSAVKTGIVSGAKFLAPAAASMFSGGSGPAAPQSGGIDPNTYAGPAGDWGSNPQPDAGGGYSGGGGGEPVGVTVTGGGVMPEIPGATVEVTDTMPEDGPPWLLIGAAALAIFLIVKKKRS